MVLLAELGELGELVCTNMTKLSEVDKAQC